MHIQCIFEPSLESASVQNLFFVPLKDYQHCISIEYQFPDQEFDPSDTYLVQVSRSTCNRSQLFLNISGLITKQLVPEIRMGETQVSVFMLGCC